MNCVSFSLLMLTKVMDLILFSSMTEVFLQIYMYFFFTCSLFYDSDRFIVIFDHTKIDADTMCL